MGKIERVGFGAFLAAALAAAACGDDDGGTGGSGGAGGDGGTGAQGGGGSSACIQPGADDTTTVQTALIEAASGSTVCLAEGAFSFTTELSLDVDGVTLQGAGSDRTILDFSGQDVGANGLIVRGDGVTLQDFGVRNTPGDGIRADSVAGITFARVAVVWDADASEANGAYGFYPVGSTDVTIDACVVKGARDAGVYVGQSQGIVVTNSETFGNVIGIEIENSTDALLRDNYAHDNTAGILIVNLPGLPVQDGKRTNVYNNRIENNNVPNFGVPGTIVAQVPHGIGVLIVASDDNEIRENEIRGNGSSGVVVSSYIELLFGPAEDPDYDLFPQGNFVHDNLYENNGTAPSPLIDGLTDVTPIPDVMWDGCVDAAAPDDGHLVNCVSEPTATYVMFNYCMDFPAPSQDVTSVTCTYEPLPIR